MYTEGLTFKSYKYIITWGGGGGGGGGLRRSESCTHALIFLLAVKPGLYIYISRNPGKKYLPMMLLELQYYVKCEFFFKPAIPLGKLLYLLLVYEC